MSPEQARREPTDRRTDIWSLGVVIYEMVTGRLPFEGERQEAVAYAIVHEEPEAMTAQRVDVPVELDRVVNKTLAKDPGERYPHVEDLLVDLRALQKKQESGSGRPVPAPAVLSRGRRTGWYAAAAAVVVAGLAGVTWIGIFETGSQVPAEPMRLVPLTSYPGLEYDPDFSPDGEQVTFSWNGEKQDNFDIYVRSVDSDNPQRLTTHAAVEERPAWSPDGRWIAFERSEETGKSSILLIPSIGGPERKVTVVERFKRSRLAWLPDSTGLIIADGNPSSLFTVSIETGEKRQLTKPPEGMWGDVDPVLSADAHSLAFVRFNGRWSKDAYLLDLDAEFKPLGAATPLTSDGRAFVQAWSPDEQDLIVSRGAGHSWGYLHRVSVAGAPNELRRLDVVGSGVRQAAVSAGRNRMVCVRESKDWDLEVLEKTGAESDSWDSGSFPSSTRLEAGPRYSPDGKWLAFESNRTGPFGIWLSAADGTGAREVMDSGKCLSRNAALVARQPADRL